MENQKPDEPLPSGWRVEVKVRKNGRKYKCYVNRAKGLKFYSKVEVIRHLNEKCVKSEEKNNSTKIETADNVVTENAAKEGLPPGWIKEIKITKSGRNVRKDPYYSDPVSGYVFRSLKNAQRFVETGEVGRNTIRTNGRSNDDDDDDSKDIKFSSPIGGKGKEEKLVEDDEARPFVTESPSSLKSEVNGDEDKKIHSGGAKLKTKKEVVNLPRRASKRLAGIELDPTPEVKTGNRTRRTSIQRRSDEAVYGKTESPNGVDFSPDKIIEDEPEPKPKHAKYAPEMSKITEVSVEADERKNLSADMGTSNGVDFSKSKDLPVDVSETALADLWTDPCIAFAIQTLTGKSFDPPINADVSPSKGEYMIGNGEFARDNGVNGGGHSEMIQNNHIPKTEEKQDSPLDLPYADIWRDPCIEFAIKTLTGAIPVGCDDRDYIQQPLTAVGGGGGGFPLPDASVDKFCHTDYLCNQYDVVEKPGACLNLSIGNSGGVCRFGP